MAHRGLVAVGAVLVLLSSVPLFRITAVNFTPEDDQSQFDVTLRAPEGTSLAAMEVLANRLGAAIRQIPEVEFTLVTVAGDTAGTLNTATMLVRLHPIEDRERDQFAVMAEVRDRILPEYVKARLAHRGAARRRPGRRRRRHPVHDPGPGARAAREVQRRAARSRRWPIPGLVDVDTTLNAGKPEMSVLSRSAEGRRPRRADRRCRRGAAAAGGRRSGDDLQRSRRAVRSAPARAGRRIAARRRRWPACRCPRRGSASSRSTTSRPSPHSDSPATISRMGRQRQVTLNANMLPGTSQAHGAGSRSPPPPRELELRPRIPRRLRRPLARAQSHRHRVPDRDRAVVHLHVPDPGGAVRIVAAPGDDPAVAAADAAVRAAVADHLPAVAQHLLGAGPAGAVRRGEEELDSADRSRQPAARRRA